MKGCSTAGPCPKRLRLFLLACLPTRALLLALAVLVSSGKAPGSAQTARTTRIALGVLGLAIGAGLLYTYARKGNGGTGFAGGERYWDSLSHGLLYLSFGISFLLGAAGAWVFLAADLLLAVVTVARHYA